MHGKSIRLIILAFMLTAVSGLGMVLTPGQARAQLVPGAGAEAPLTDQYTQVLTGNYCYVTGGNSLILVDSADFEINVPGTPVAAYWVWSSRVILGNGDSFPDPIDNTLTVTGTRGDGAAINTEITASIQEESTFSGYIRSYAFVYSDNLFDFVSEGLNAYTISGIEVPTFEIPESHGAALTIVYEADNCPYQQIDLAYGLDTFFHDWAPPFGPNSAVACVAFDPAAESRTLSYTVIVAGAAQPEVADATRPSGFWTAAINAPNDVLPASLVGEAFATGIADPFNSTPGLEWDIYSGQVTLAAGDNYACFQAESPVGDGDPGGISGAWLNLTTGTPLALGSIGDTVWADLNGNGTQDPGEPGLANVTVSLSNGASVTTDADGNYLFTDLPPASYTVTIDPNSGDLATGNYTQTGDPDGGNDNQSQLTLGAGEVNLDQDFGYQPLGSIGDTVWLDVDGNGVINGDEAGIANVTVTLINSQNQVQVDVTDGDGLYTFENLPADNYTVIVNPTTLPDNLKPTYDPDGISTPNEAALLLGPGEDRDDIDFGYNSILGSLGDTVWLDENRNGVQDNGEGGIPNVLLALSDGNGGSQTAVTNGSGFYSFVDLMPGTYTVSVDPTTLPTGLGPTFDLDGTNTPNTTQVALAAGQVRVDVDFGYVDIVGSIGDTVWRDDNGNGVQESGEPGLAGVTLTLSNNDGSLGSTVTDANGLYTFDDLLAGQYTVAVDPASLPGDVRQTYDLDGLSTPDRATAALAQAEDRTDVDFGYQPLGSIGDTVWHDSNANGVQEGDEQGLAGVTVVLTRADGVRSFAQTDGNGRYAFTSLPPGAYTVAVDPTTLPEGYLPTYDLDGVTTPNTTSVPLAAWQNRTDVDFGYREPPLSIDDEAPSAPRGTVAVFLPLVTR